MTRKQRKQKQNRRAAVLGTVVVCVLLGILVADFHDNGEIDNGRFLIVALFVFSGAGAGAMLDNLANWYLGGRDDDGSDDGEA